MLGHYLGHVAHCAGVYYFLIYLHRIQKKKKLTVKDASTFSTVHGKAQKTDLRAVQLYEKKEPKIPQDQTLKFSRKKSVKS
eukprot:COSAG05_NODE_275_length_12406_cov_12.621841_22_plen_80_part_01